MPMGKRQISRTAKPGRKVASRDKVAPTKSKKKESAKKAAPKKKVRISKSETVSKEKVAAARKKAGGSNVGKYKNVSSDEFAGPSGGAPKGSYPINTRKRAVSALKLAHNAPNPGGIKKKVYAEYPGLKKKAKK